MNGLPGLALKCAAVLSVCVLAACSAAPSQISDEEFLSRVDGLGSYVTIAASENGGDRLLGLGEGLCADLAEQSDEEGRVRFLEYYLAAAIDAGDDAGDVAVFARASIERFCPQFSGE